MFGRVVGPFVTVLASFAIDESKHLSENKSLCLDLGGWQAVVTLAGFDTLLSKPEILVTAALDARKSKETIREKKAALIDPYQISILKNSSFLWHPSANFELNEWHQVC